MRMSLEAPCYVMLYFHWSSLLCYVVLGGSLLCYVMLSLKAPCNVMLSLVAAQSEENMVIELQG